jgi:hypothetical protein
MARIEHSGVGYIYFYLFSRNLFGKPDGDYHPALQPQQTQALAGFSYKKDMGDRGNI